MSHDCGYDRSPRICEIYEYSNLVPPANEKLINRTDDSFTWGHTTTTRIVMMKGVTAEKNSRASVQQRVPGPECCTVRRPTRATVPVRLICGGLPGVVVLGWRGEISLHCLQHMSPPRTCRTSPRISRHRSQRCVVLRCSRTRQGRSRPTTGSSGVRVVRSATIVTRQPALHSEGATSLACDSSRRLSLTRVVIRNIRGCGVHMTRKG